MPGLFCSGMGAPVCRSRMDSHCTDRRGVQRGKAPLALGHPIGASSIPVGKGSLEGNSVPLGGRFPKEGSAFLGTRLSLGKSSVLYLCFRLTRERGWRRTLRCGRVWQQTLFRGSRTGGFCDVSYSTNAGFLRSKIRLAGKGSEGIYINRSITQMQLMQSCVWVIFCFRPPHQIVAGNTVIVSQHQNAIRADVLAVIRFIFAECGF